jgi:3-hydroxyisobutyrate dehydrogenase-like beta-hydroxyacid dehydrogenase
MNILWIGYGKMGRPMCSSVRKSGHRISVLDAGAAQRSAAAADGFDLAKDGRSAAAAAELIVTSLPNDAACIEALIGADGALLASRSGAILIETSTISVAASRQIAEVADARGVRYLRAPVSGTVGAASSGKLTTFVSGPADALERTRETIGSYAAKILLVGPDEQARVMKLAVNLMVTTLMVSLSEAYAFCRKGGVAPEIAIDAICNSAIGSPHLKFKAESLLRQDFTPTFTVTQTRKDMKLINEAARDLDAPIILGAAVEQIFTAGAALGFSDEDYIACGKVIGRLAGLTP